MIRIVRVADVKRAAAKLAAAQPKKDISAARRIFESVQRGGDRAILYHEKKFTGAAPAKLRVPEAEIKSAMSAVTKEQRAAITLAKSRLEKTESAVLDLLQDTSTNFEGVRVLRSFAPLRRVGCYVPGGLARYPSTVVMSVVPARVAGVREIAVASPPNAQGHIDPLTLAAAKICGATEVYCMGGAQAIAALSVGTNSVPRVDKIVGPGGSIVSAAKSVASAHTAIDMIAGPTELGIVADRTANPRHVALDLISQAEHGPDTRCYLITDSANVASAVQAELARLTRKIGRQKVVLASLRGNGFAAVCRSRKEMILLANLLAPEHLQIMVERPASMASSLFGPGMVLVGSHTPSAASDYILGSNHILPTSGSGRTRGSLSVLDFVKLGTRVRASKAALKEASEHIRALTSAEGLSNHYEAVRGRM